MKAASNTELKPDLITGERLYTFTVFPDALNYAGTLFGGRILAEMDLAASNTARRLLYDSPCDGIVTAHVSEVDFLQPAYLGDIVELRTKLTRIGRSSLTVQVSVHRESLNGGRHLICKASFVLVALRKGKPFPHNVQFQQTIIPESN
ncbi:MAG: acyl-CoA thioesterase [Flavobacteriales bacterium]|nr:acyl-CoA thioesterase [Flavobacteriales bacterium]